MSIAELWSVSSRIVVSERSRTANYQYLILIKNQVKIDFQGLFYDIIQLKITTMKYKKIKIGILTGLVFYTVFHILYLIVLKAHWWEIDDLKYFMPIWTAGMFYVGYGLSKKYYNKKESIIQKYYQIITTMKMQK